jgi:hypothetical protein
MGDSLDSYMSISTLQMQHLEGQLSADTFVREPGIHLCPSTKNGKKGFTNGGGSAFRRALEGGVV